MMSCTPYRRRVFLVPNATKARKGKGIADTEFLKLPEKRGPLRKAQPGMPPRARKSPPQSFSTPPKTHSTPPQTHSTPPKIHITCHDSTFYDIRKRAFWARISPAENSQRLHGYVLSRYSLLLPLSKATKRQLYNFPLKSLFFRAESSFSRT